jgi:hypothetical protein
MPGCQDDDPSLNARPAVFDDIGSVELLLIFPMYFEVSLSHCLILIDEG